MRDEHTSDLAELSMDASVTNIRKKSLQGLAMMRDATMQDTEALDAMEAKVIPWTWCLKRKFYLCYFQLLNIFTFFLGEQN